MADNQFKTFSYRLLNGGVVARHASDTLPPGTYRNLQNMESRAEGALATRYGLQALTQNGSANQPLGAPVHSLGKLQSLGPMYRYAGVGTALYRSPVPTAFTQVASGLSGSRLSMSPYRPATNANPWMFVADKTKLVKDSGSGAAQNWGLAPPVQPPTVQIGDPAKTIIEEFNEANTSSFTFASYTGTAINVRVQGTFAATGSTLGIVTFTEVQPTASGFSRTSNVATVTTSSPHGWVSGMRIKVVYGFDTSFNASSVVITVTSTTTFTYSSVGPNASSSGSPATLSALPSFSPFMLVDIDAGGNPETVLILSIIPNVGFTANQSSPHTSPMLYSASYLQGTVAANATGTITKKGTFDFTGTSAAPNNVSLSVVSASRTSGVSTLNLGALVNPPAWKAGDNIFVSLGDFSTSSSPITGVAIVGGNFLVSYQQLGLPNETGGTGTVQRISGNSNIAQDTDYFSLWMQAGDPFGIAEIRVLFDVGDGSFTKDYYYKSITPSTSQPAVSGTLRNGDVLTQQVFARAAGLTDNRRTGYQSQDLLPSDLRSLRQLRPANLNTGKTAWTNVQMMRGEFIPVGAAGSATNGWDKVVAWQISIRTQPNSSVIVGIDDLVFIAGSQLDSFNGNPYDYRITLYNINTGLESNPSVTLAPSLFISPRRQPALIGLNQTSLNTELAGSGANVGAGTAWTSPNNITSLSSYASVSAGNSQALAATQFGFTLALGTLLSSLLLTFKMFWSQTGTGIFSIGVQLLKNGSPFGSSQIVPLTSVGTSGGTSGAPIGAQLSFDTSALGVSDINNSQFGFQLSLFRFGGTGTMSLSVRAGTLSAVVGAPIDPQTTHWRIYRRGGTLTQAWYRVGQVPITTTTYLDTTSDATIELNDQLIIDNDPPVSSTMPVPLNDSITSITQTTIPGVATILFADSPNNVFPGQFVTVGSGDTAEQAYVLAVQNGGNQIQLWLQTAHSVGEIVSATEQPQAPVNLMAIAFDKAWLAGDPNNPHVLYYSNPFSPETFPQENFIEVGTPDAPIMALVEHRGLLYAFTTKTIFQIIGAGSAVPVALPTGVKHGLSGNFAWAKSEGVIYYESYDGIYVFTGAASTYLTEPVEWIFTAQNLGPIQAEGIGQKANTVMAYGNRELFVSYVDANGFRRRMIYHETYKRWRNDDSAQTAITAMKFEDDTGSLIVGGADGMVYQDRLNDYDWGAYDGNRNLIPAPINFALQTGQMDQEVPKANKQYQEFTLDANLNGQSASISLIFDGGATVLPLGTLTGTGRQQYQMKIQNGLGYRSQNIGVLIAGSSTAPVFLHDVHVRALVEAESRQSFDSYWLRFGTDQWKVAKQCWIEYAATDASGIAFAMYVDGDMSMPLFTFTLPQSANRRTTRVRFPANKATMFRFIGISSSDFQLYMPESHVDVKEICVGKGYQKAQLTP